MAGHIF